MKSKSTIFCLALLLLVTPITYVVYKTETLSQLWHPPLSPQAAKDLARSVTVRIFNQNGAGSGVIIAVEGTKYTVLTNNHVVELLTQKPFWVLTPDGKKHQGKAGENPRLVGLDLCMVTFVSTNDYQVAPVSAQKIIPNSPIYASGFPNYRTVSADRLEDTRSWGTKAFHFTQGTFVMRLEGKALEGGYQLGYTNEVEQGMSGGPVLDRHGRLVGVNGRLKYPIQGIDAFPFTDGTQPTKELYQEMESLSWAIPIAFLAQSRESP